MGAALGACLALEAGFRIAGVRAQFHVPPRGFVLPPFDKLTDRQPFMFIPDAVYRMQFHSDPRGYFGPQRCIDHRHNAAGWRDVEHPLEKPPGTRRILGLGDSYLWGQGVRREDTMLARLEHLLNEHSTGPRFETINAGLPALNTRDQAALLRERGLQYSPDFVIVHFVPNDVEDGVFHEGARRDFPGNEALAYLRPDRLSHCSRAWGWARQRFLMAKVTRAHVRRYAGLFEESSEPWQKCRAALNEIHRTCAENGIRLLVAVFPFYYELDGAYPFQPAHDAVRTHCEQEGMPHLDLRAAYRAFKGPELWVHPADEHPNEIAHRVAAEAIFDHLLLNARELGLEIMARPAPESAARVTGADVSQ